MWSPTDVSSRRLLGPLRAKASTPLHERHCADCARVTHTRRARRRPPGLCVHGGDLQVVPRRRVYVATSYEQVGCAHVAMREQTPSPNRRSGKTAAAAVGDCRSTFGAREEWPSRGPRPIGTESDLVDDESERRGGRESAAKPRGVFSRRQGAFECMFICFKILVTIVCYPH